MRHFKSLLLISLVAGICLTGCLPEREPGEVLKSYISLLLRGYLDQAYELLSFKIQDKSTREEIIKAISIYRGKLITFYILTQKIEDNLATVKYELIFVDNNGQEKKLTSVASLSYENNNWKILNPGF